MHLLGLHPLDVTVIVIALLAILFVGFIASRGSSHENEFFAGGRRLPAWLQFFINFGNMTDSNGAPMVASEVQRQGASGLWIPFQPLFSTPFYWFSSIWYRRTRLITAPDQFIERFNSRRLALAFALFWLITVPMSGALGNMVSYKVAAAMLIKPEAEYTTSDRQMVATYQEYQGLKKEFAAGTLAAGAKERFQTLDSQYQRNELSSTVSYISPTPFYWAYVAVVMMVILMGGIKAAAYADVIQGLLIIILSFMLIPLGLAQVGGFAGLHQALPPHVFELFGTGAGSEYTWYSIAAFVFMGLVCIGTMAGCGTSIDERACRFGVLSGAFSKRLVMIAWMVCGLLAMALCSGQIADPDHAWGALSRHLLGPGLLGLMIAGILLGHMPSVGTQTINFSASFTRNLYQPLVPGKSEAHYMLVAKLAIVFVLIAGILGAQFFTGIISLFTTMVSIGAFTGALGLLMLFWRGLTARAAGWGWALWMIFLVAIPWGLPQVAALRTHPHLTARTQEITTTSTGKATAAEVAAGKAAVVGAPITRIEILPPHAIYFDSVVRSIPQDPQSPLEGRGRFHIELVLLDLIGLPLDTWNKAALMTGRWLVDALGPFAVLFVLSWLLKDRRPKATTDAERQGLAPATYADVIMNGNIAMLHNPRETEEQAQVRLDRYYAKLKTPIGASPEADQVELATSFADPTRFDHRKLFPGSAWEMQRWSTTDALAFAGLWLIVLAIIGLMLAILGYGT